MDTPTPAPPLKAATPWFKDPILVGIATAIVTQAIKVTPIGKFVPVENIPGLVDWLLDAVSTAALYIASHWRAFRPVPPVVTATSAEANAINSQVSQTKDQTNAQVSPGSPSPGPQP